MDDVRDDDSPVSAVADGFTGKGAGEKEKETGSVPYFSLFRFANRLDYVYMFAGTLGAIADGMLLPTGVILFIRLVNGFNKIITDPDYERRTADKYIRIMLWVAPIMGSVAFWSLSAGRALGSGKRYESELSTYEPF